MAASWVAGSPGNVYRVQWQRAYLRCKELERRMRQGLRVLESLSM